MARKGSVGSQKGKPTVAPEQPAGTMGGPNAAMRFREVHGRGAKGHRGMETNTARGMGMPAPDLRAPSARSQAPRRQPERPSR